MAKAGYCKECGKNVWLSEDGSGQCGHPASSISNVYEAEPGRELPTVAKTGVLNWLRAQPFPIKVVLGVVAVLTFFYLVGLVSRASNTRLEVAKEAPKETRMEAEKPKEEEVTAEEPAEEVKVVEPQPIELAGTGQQASQKFALESGLSVFRMKHSGGSNFIISLLDSNGQRIESLVNEIGSFDGAKAVNIVTEGEYLLDIKADGSWTVRIEQPRPTSAQSKPKTFSGKGQQVSEFIELDAGLTIFKLKHEGSSNFIVSLLDAKGRRIESLVNEIGAFDGSKAVGISDAGIYILDIKADGNWTISVE